MSTTTDLDNKTILARSYVLAWLALPNLVLLGVYNDALSPLPEFLLVLLVTSIGFFYLFPSFRWFALANIPFALLAGGYAAYIFVYRSIPYEGMWFSIWDMVYVEVIDLGSYYFDLILLNLAGFGLYVFCALRAHSPMPRVYGRRKPALLVCLLVIFGVVAGQNFLSGRLSLGVQSIGTSFAQSFPLGMAYQAYSTWIHSGQHEKYEASVLPELNHLAPAAEGRELYLLVIGETARGDRWLLDLEHNHYDTIESGNAVLFADAFSQANYTDGSLHLLLTGASTYQESKGAATLPQISRAADCQTIWISNNKAYRYSFQADYSIIAEQGSATPLLKRYDHAMLPDLYRAIGQSEDRACIVVHLLGSHFSYLERYPHKFNQKEVSLADYRSKFSDGHVAALRNAYDNSIHATNDFLDQLIRFVDRQDATSVLIYTSDHGENLYDDERQLFQHIMKTPSIFEARVPFMIWASDEFIDRFPQKWSNLRSNGKRPVSNKQILPTFIDLLQVDYARQHFSVSLLSAYDTDPTRYILSPDLRLLPESEIN